MGAHPRILIATRLHDSIAAEPLGPLIDYCPALARAGEQALPGALLERVPDIVIGGHAAIRPEMLARWHEKAGRPLLLIRTPGAGRTSGASASPECPGVQVMETAAHDNAVGDLALGQAERWLARQMASTRLARFGIGMGGGRAAGIGGERIVLVGAGIVNLITALELDSRGARVEIFDAGPDPRQKLDWRRYGTTHGGANARMFCFTEAHNYNDQGRASHAHRRAVLRKTVTQGGWLLVPYAELSQMERDWIHGFENVPPWRARVFAEDIYGINMASGLRWAELRTRQPGLFERVGFTDGVLRLYATPELYDEAVQLQGRLGALRHTLTPAELATHHPGLGSAVERGALAGGLHVEGFTLNIHDFVARILDHLQARGVGLHWQRPVTGIAKTEEGLVDGLRVDGLRIDGQRIDGLRVDGAMDKGGVVRAKHYIISPGAHGEVILQGTRSAAKIQGICGVWLFLPNIDICLSMKLHRQGGVGEDTNITMATDHQGNPALILGSGYGFVGRRSLDSSSPEVARLFAALEQTAAHCFPREHARAVQSGTLFGARQVCVRPFSTTGLGIFEVMATADGGRLVITTGHNSGGFAQAPEVAHAVAQTLAGQRCDMQALYDPERGYEDRLQD